MRLAHVLLVLCACGGTAGPSLVSTPAGDGGVDADAGAPAGGGATDAGVQPSGPWLAGCSMVPPDNEWDPDISADAVEPHPAPVPAYTCPGPPNPPRHFCR